MTAQSVLFDTITTNDKHLIGSITLNAEASLNSLTLEMIKLISKQLTQWEQQNDIVCVIMQGAGEKAFCAGGDVIKLYQAMKDISNGNENNYPTEFFSQEYQLDYQIHTYSKPIICWGNGIVMGGGIGIMAGASHRIVTENSRLAMPEITIGLYPDVGGSWFLNRMPGRVGLFLGLTGSMLNAADAIFVGLADRFIESQHYQVLLSELINAQWLEKNYHQVTGRVIRRLEKQSIENIPFSNILTHYSLIQQLTDHEKLETIMYQISRCEESDKWLQRAKETAKNGCPTTAHLIFQQLKRAKHLSLADVFKMELIMSVQCAHHPDCQEGIRALLIDKDKQPNWKYKSISEVPDSWIEEHFTAPWEAHPLMSLDKAA